jgi:hypothetical protein
LTLVDSESETSLASTTIDPINIFEGDSLHKIAAASRISILDIENSQEISRLTQEFSVLSIFSAFVLVEKREQVLWNSMELLSEVENSLLKPLANEFMAENVREEEEFAFDQERLEIEEFSKKQEIFNFDREFKLMIVDMGTSLTKAGISEDAYPPVMSATVVGRPRHMGVMVGMGQKVIFFPMGWENLCEGLLCWWKCGNRETREQSAYEQQF